MRFLIILLFVAATAMADVEIVPLSTDSDVSFVSWIGWDEYAHLGRYEGDSLVAEVTTAGDYDASVGVCEFAPDSHIVLYISSTYNEYTDTLWTYTSSSLSQMDYWTIEGYHEHYSYSFLKNPDARWNAFLAIYSYDCFSSMTHCYWKSMELSVSASGEVDSLFSLCYSLYKGTGSNTDLPQVFTFLGPVLDGANSWPMFCADYTQPGGSFPSEAALRSFVHNPPADSVNLLEDCFYWATNWSVPDWPPTLMALGSCSDEAIALWEDVYGQVFFSEFDCMSPESLYSAPYPWDYPGEVNSCAMSANPEDAGMLLAWYRNGQIRCRHYQDGWNGFDHVVETGVGTVPVDNIAVSSVDDGYWIAWLETGSSEPELVFVDRGTVTGIEEGSPEPLSPVINLFPNPCNRFLSIELADLSLSGSARILIHDCSGRLVSEIDLEGEEQVATWNCSNRSGERCDHGIYFVTLIGSGSSVTEKVLLLD